jgi:hypothetical protein
LPDLFSGLDHSGRVGLDALVKVFFREQFLERLRERLAHYLMERVHRGVTS